MAGVYLEISDCIFFVKQKTAYEMRISDWSSDVCSADLMPGSWKAQLSQMISAEAAVLTSAMAPSTKRDRSFIVRVSCYLLRVRLNVQIGRASCRERVCQYV